MPAFGIISAHFHRCLYVFSIEAIDEARLANTGSADEHGRVTWFNQFRQFLHAPSSDRTGREHRCTASHASQRCKLRVKVLAQIDLIENDHWVCAAFMCHDEHLLQNNRVETHVRGGYQEGRVDIGGQDLLGGATSDHFTGELGVPRKNSMNNGLLFVRYEPYCNPISDLGKF